MKKTLIASACMFSISLGVLTVNATPTKPLTNFQWAKIVAGTRLPINKRTGQSPEVSVILYAEAEYNEVHEKGTAGVKAAYFTLDPPSVDKTIELWDESNGPIVKQGQIVEIKGYILTGVKFKNYLGKMQYAPVIIGKTVKILTPYGTVPLL